MKKIKMIFLFVIVLAQFKINAQNVNGVPLKEIKVDYVQIVGTSKFMNPNKCTIEIDFGQLNKLWSADDTKLIGEDGKQLEFNSMIDALNFMYKNNYEFVTAYVLTMGNQNVYHYLLKRKNN